MQKKTLIIAEVGVNHNGDPELAKELIEVARNAGADVVKFQTFNALDLVTHNAQKTEYQKNNTGDIGSQLEMLQELQLSEESHRALQNHCNDIGIEFLSTPFDNQSLYFLVDDLKLKTLKISSGDLTNGPLLHKCAKTGCGIILSTGMSNITEIREALGVLAHGYISDQPPNKVAFDEAYQSPAGTSALETKVILLHCTSQYPAPINELHLNAIPYMKEQFGLRVGYSDHSDGIIASIAAAAIGADVIEKHITLDKNMAGPDHKASLDPEELSAVVNSIRIVDRAMGKHQKTLQSSERETLKHVRKSIVAAVNIEKGEKLTVDNITTKRPSIGRSPMDYWEVIGQECTQKFLKDEPIT